MFSMVYRGPKVRRGKNHLSRLNGGGIVLELVDGLG